MSDPLTKPVIFGTACVGGVVAWAIVHPFNTVAVRMNLATPPSSFFVYASNMVKTEGARSVYAGLGAGCLRQVFYATSRYGLFETFRDGLATHRETDFAQRLVCASGAGACAAVISCPLEVCLVRLSNDAALPAAQRRGYASVLDAFARIRSEEGVAAFWRPCRAFVARAMLVGATQVATYDQFKAVFASLGLSPGAVANQLCSSMGAGLIFSVATSPLETAKNRIAFQKPDASGRLPYAGGTLRTIAAVARADGLLALWSGFLPYYGRCGGHTIVMFSLVEEMRNFYRRAVLGEPPRRSTTS
jgi:solute carrier family 25 oxoglutarate transporter 11